MNNSTNVSDHNGTASNAETANTDSRQVSQPSQGIESYATQNENHFASFPNGFSSQEVLSLVTLREEPVYLNHTEIPPSLIQAINYQAMAQNSLQAEFIQLGENLQELSKEKANMNMELSSLSSNVSKLEKEKNELEKLVAGERKECLNKQREIDDCNVKLDEKRQEAKQHESLFKEERDDGIAKALIIEEQQETIANIQRKSEETERELREAKDVTRRIVDEYFDSMTRPTTMNQLLLEYQARNPIQFPMPRPFANYILEHAQSSQEERPIIAGTSTSKRDVATQSKQRKHSNENEK